MAKLVMLGDFLKGKRRIWVEVRIEGRRRQRPESKRAGSGVGRFIVLETRVRRSPYFRAGHIFVRDMGALRESLF